MDMDPEIEASLTKVLKAFQEFSSVYDRKADELRMKGFSAERIRPILEGAEAMKDSASIYLSWAKFYADKISNPNAEKRIESF